MATGKIGPFIATFVALASDPGPHIRGPVSRRQARRMRNLNSITVVGYLGADADFRDAEGRARCSLSIATNRKFKDRNGEEKEATDWHRVTCWGFTAKAARDLKKGQPVVVVGSMQSRTYETADGQKVYTVELHADTIASVLKAVEDAA